MACSTGKVFKPTLNKHFDVTALTNGVGHDGLASMFVVC